MKGINHSKPLPTINDIHVSDESTIIEFLNTNSHEIGAVKYLGSFIDDVKIQNDFGIKVNLQFLIVEREATVKERPGNLFIKDNGGISNIFEFDYNLPHSIPNKQTEKENYIVKATIETHSCNPEATCSKCSGSGNCRSCDGNGYKRCSDCIGTGKVERKVGKLKSGEPKYGKVGCYNCQGSGRKSCTSCKGSGKCVNCQGNGKVICKRCDGTSHYQTYISYSSSFKPVVKEFYYSDYPEIIKAIALTKNKVSFNDDLLEWSNSNTIHTNNKEKAIKTNRHSKEVISELENLAELSPHQMLGRIHSEIETVPITIVDYSFEDKDFQLLIVGENNIVCYSSLPKKHSYKTNVFQRLINFFTNKKRKIAFTYIASYMFNADGSVDEPEVKLLDLFLNNIQLKQTEKNLLIDDLKRNLSIEDITPKIKVIKSDLRALVFAWQCVMQDGKINSNEEIAFTKLSKLFKVDEEGLAKIKHKATKFAHLKDSEMLEEYFKA